MQAETKFSRLIFDIKPTTITSARQRDRAEYTVEARFLPPNSNNEIKFVDDVQISIDYNKLRELNSNKEEYGQYLSDCLFVPKVLSAWSRAIGENEGVKSRLRFQLHLSAKDGRLHQICWESLQDPIEKTFVARQSKILMSRFAYPSTRTNDELIDYRQSRVLVIIANPIDSSMYGLEFINEEIQQERLRDVLKIYKNNRLLIRKPGYNPVTYALISEQLRSGYEIVHLICHGRIVDGKTYLFLEDDSGYMARLEGEKLIQLIQGLVLKPRLFILSACYSTGSNHFDVIDPLGYKLAEAGINVVITVQDRAHQISAIKFASVFLQSVVNATQGQVEEAMVSARETMSDEDWWNTAIYTNLRDGRLFLSDNERGHKEDRSGLRSQTTINSLVVHTNILREAKQQNLTIARQNIKEKQDQANIEQQGIHTIEPLWCHCRCKFIYYRKSHTPNTSSIRQQGSTLFVAKYPITVAQFRRFIDEFGGAYDTTKPYWTKQGALWLQENGYPFPNGWDDPNLADNQPVRGVSWYEAVAFCEWLTQKLQLLDQGKVIRLPTEYEWERAARWSEKTMEYKQWEEPDHLFLAASKEVSPTSLFPPPVGCFPDGASPCGALDMAGGVWEWCASLPSRNTSTIQVFEEDVEYIYDPTTNKYPEMPARGGSWNTPKSEVGWLAREYFQVHEQNPNVGFRVVLSELAPGGEQ